MIDQISFQTAARTVDHLGREQIADTPTAVSELWKNAYDAYARDVELNIYDGEVPVASILDNGHGMNKAEFVGRWLVVGTESKATGTATRLEDRDGLKERPRQGQKGIGRLSCANLGPILLFVSKRSSGDFVASLIDWRLFENPFLTLSDIRLPVVEFAKRDDLLPLLPGLATQLLENLSGGADADHRARVVEAWSSFDALYVDEARLQTTSRVEAPSKSISDALKKLPFEERHLSRWEVWSGASPHGTALLVSGLNFDLQMQITDRVLDSAARGAKERLYQTLSGFVDPFADPEHPELNAVKPEFSYAVRTWRGDRDSFVLGTEKHFDRKTIEPLEHHIEGRIDAHGVFRGRVKAFGEWLGDTCVIEPPADLAIGTRADTLVGPFDLFIASMEFTSANTTHAPAQFQLFRDLAERSAGFLMYRDGLRVMPYGRPDNDFFEIESRRSRSAGREFWNHRQMFGRLAISRARNPNLKDKAGREGLLDNRAAKTLKEIVSNILMVSARRYFGSASEIRKDLLPEIRDANARQKAAEAREKLRKKQHAAFRAKLLQSVKEAPLLSADVHRFAVSLNLDREQSVINAQAALETFQSRFLDLQLGEAPRPLGSLEDSYNRYREEMGGIQIEIAALADRLHEHLSSFSLAEPELVLKRQIDRNSLLVKGRIDAWQAEIKTLQTAEHARIGAIIAQRREAFSELASPLLHRLKTGDLTLAEAADFVEKLKTRLDRENSDILVPYIGALESLRDSIDLHNLATAGIDELSELRVELDRLNSLAQLGIAVEIVGHELQAFDEIIATGLRNLPEDVRSSRAAKDIEFGHHGLTDQLRFLSPLRLAGQRVDRWISGAEIRDYISEFFSLTLTRNKIRLVSTDAFSAFRVFDQQSRLFPVFINLVNNAIYWASLGAEESGREIRLSVVGDRIVVSDSGPGVAPEDVQHLFSLFFTKRARGGRGVGLYLSRANLAAGGHRISYATDAQFQVLQGANFVIEFRGGEFA